ncbi:MAG: CDP-glycerol glycerophosphotransferase family protein [Parcubacteria group bacterium]|nr:CDP-glycerol glycerophosphotransferase family protein [Parcubacteria group bacterium]
MTLLLTISRGAIARNMLQNAFYDSVKRRFEKVVIVTPAAHDARFREAFGAPNVEMVSMPVEQDTFWDTLVTRLYKFLIFNESTVGRGLYWYIEISGRLAWIFKLVKFTAIRMVFQPLSHVSWARRALQRLDYLFLQKQAVAHYKQLFEKYQPSVVFATNIIEEEAIIKAARRQQIPVFAMPKTWDNPSKRYFRAKADKVFVWSPYMKEQMMRLQDYRDTEVEVMGIPQFDYYTDRSRHESREDFCLRVGLNPKKKIICFGSEGKVMLSDVPIAEMLSDFVDKRMLCQDCQLFIRPHFGYKNDEKKFGSLAGKPGVVIDTYNHPSKGFRDEWDYSTGHMNHFLSVVRHADVLVNTGSTLTLDAAALGTPTVLITFDGYEKKPFHASSARWYVCDYYTELMRYRPALVARDPESLRETINTLLRESNRLADSQKAVCARLCFKLDGKSGERYADAVACGAQAHYGK